MRIPKTYEIAVSKMLKGTLVRLNAEGRKFWIDPDGYNPRGDVWNYIQAVNCDDTVNLCTQNHLLRPNVEFSHIAW